MELGEGLGLSTLSSLIAGEGLGLSSRAEAGLGSCRLGMRNFRSASGLGKWRSVPGAGFSSLEFSSNLLFNDEPEVLLSEDVCLGLCSRVGVASCWLLARGAELINMTCPLMLPAGGEGCWLPLVRFSEGELLLVRVARGDGCWLLLVRVARGDGCWLVLVIATRGDGCWLELVRAARGDGCWLVLVRVTRGDGCWLVLLTSDGCRLVLVRVARRGCWLLVLVRVARGDGCRLVLVRVARRGCWLLVLVAKGDGCRLVLVKVASGAGCWLVLVRVARGDGCWLVRVASGDGCWLVRVARGDGCRLVLVRVARRGCWLLVLVRVARGDGCRLMLVRVARRGCWLLVLVRVAKGDGCRLVLVKVASGAGCWLVLVRVARGDGCWLVRVASGDGCWLVRVARGDGCRLVRVARGDGCWLARVARSWLMSVTVVTVCWLLVCVAVVWKGTMAADVGVVSWPQRMILESSVRRRVRGTPRGVSLPWDALLERRADMVLALRMEETDSEEAVRGSGGEPVSLMAAGVLAWPKASVPSAERAVMLPRGALGTEAIGVLETVLAVTGGLVCRVLDNFLPPRGVLPGGRPGCRRLSHVTLSSPIVTKAPSSEMVKSGGQSPGGAGSLTRLA